MPGRLPVATPRYASCGSYRPGVASPSSDPGSGQPEELPMPTITKPTTVGAPLSSRYRLANARREAGLALVEVGDRIGRYWTVIQRYEKGTAKPSADVLGALAHVLGCSIDDLYEVPRAIESPRA